MATVGSINVGVSASVAGMAKDLGKGTGLVRSFARDLTAIGGSVRTAFAGVGAAIAVAGGASVVRDLVTAAVDLEDKVIALGKATDLAGPELAGLKGELVGLSSELKGIRLDAIFEIATAGAKLGVGADQLGAYVEGVAKVSAAIDDIPAAELTDQIGKLNAVFKLSTTQGALQLGSAIDRVADSGVSSASDILALTQRISGSAAAAKISAQESIGLAGALLDTGTMAEAGASAITRLIFAFAGAPKPIESIIAFLDQLRRQDAATQLTSIKDLGVEGVQAAGEIQKLAQQVDVARRYIGLANEEFRTLNQVESSYNATARSSRSALIQIENAAQAVKDTLGSALLPAIQDVSAAVVANRAEIQAWATDAGDWIKGLTADTGNWSAALDVARFGIREIREQFLLVQIVSAQVVGNVGRVIQALEHFRPGLVDLGGFGRGLSEEADRLKAGYQEALRSIQDGAAASTTAIKEQASAAHQLGQAAAGPARLAAGMNAVADATAAAADKSQDLLARLQEEVQFYGRSQREIDFWKLAQSGATQETLRNVAALSMRLDALDKQKEAQERLAEDAQQLTESVRTPLEAFQLEAGKIQALLSKGLITQDVAGRALQAAKDRLGESDPTRDATSALTRPEKVAAAALEFGSAEARSADIAFRRGSTGDPLKDVAKTGRDSLAQHRRQTTLLEQIVHRDQAVGVRI